MEDESWPSIAVMGAGAVGCYFGGMLARAGAPVMLIGRQRHVDAVVRDGLFLEGIQVREHIPVSASTDTGAARAARIILLCVKTTDTKEAARALAPHLAGNAVVVSLQNGVDNAERIHAATGIAAVPAVVYVAAEMAGPGHIKHSGRGDLVIGDLSGRGPMDAARRRQLESLAALFARAGVPCRVSETIESDLWTKLVMNCAYNAISALSRTRYGRMAESPWAREVMQRIMDEVFAVAQAAGIRLESREIAEATWKLAKGMPGAISSTAQDIAQGRRTEIDSLNGYVARRGAELGIATPVNQTLHALVKLLEETA